MASALGSPTAPHRRRSVVHGGASGATGSGAEDDELTKSIKEHRLEVQKVTKSISHLLKEALREHRVEEAPSPQEPKTGRRGSLEVGKSFSAGMYAGLGELDKAQERLRDLMSGLHTERRNEVLEDLDSWVQVRLPTSKAELQHLRRVERDSAGRSAQAERSKEAADAAMHQHEHGADTAVKDFCSSLRSISTGRRSVAEEGLLSSGSKGAAKPDLKHSLMTDEELAKALQDMRGHLSKAEDQAWDDLWQMELEKRLNRVDVGIVPDTLKEHNQLRESGASVYEEIQRVVSDMNEDIEENERLLKTYKMSLDLVLGKADPNIMQISNEAQAVVTELREQVENDLQQELLQQRDAEFGEQLKGRDGSWNEKLEAECSSLTRKLEASSAFLGALKQKGAVMQDVAQQLQQIDGGALPRLSAVRKGMLALQGAEWAVDIIPDQVTGGMGPSVTPQQELLNAEAETLRICATCNEEQRLLNERLLEQWRASSAEREARDKLDEQKQVLQNTLATIESRRLLLEQALSLARGGGHLPPAQAGRGPPRGSQAARILEASRAAVAAANGNGELENGEKTCREAFLAEAHDDGFEDDALAVQDGVLAALRTEQARLQKECQDLEPLLLRSRAPDGTVRRASAAPGQAASLPAAEEQAEVNSQMQRLADALAALVQPQVPALDPAVTTDSFHKRCLAVAAAQRGRSGQGEQLEAVLGLHKENQELTEKIRTATESVNALRAQRNPPEKAEKEKVRGSKVVSQPPRRGSTRPSTAKSPATPAASPKPRQSSLRPGGQEDSEVGATSSAPGRKRPTIQSPHQQQRRASQKPRSLAELGGDATP